MTMSPIIHQQSAHRKIGEQGFALYLAIGFIVLISVLAGSVGTRLNVTALAEARAIDSRAARDNAEQALSEGYTELRTQYLPLPDPIYLDGHSEVFSAAETADHNACIGARETDLTGYKKFARTPLTGDSYRRYFIKRDGGNYKIYGCGFDPKGTRVTYGEYADDGIALTLTRTRRY